MAPTHVSRLASPDPSLFTPKKLPKDYNQVNFQLPTPSPTPQKPKPAPPKLKSPTAGKKASAKLAPFPLFFEEQEAFGPNPIPSPTLGLVGLTREKLAEWNRELELGGIAGSRTSVTKSHFLFAHGDVPQSLDSTKRVLDEIITDFITEMCFEAARSAQIANRQKIKVDDVKFACRKNPAYLGKIQEIFDKKAELATVRKIFDANDDKITKSNVKALEEEPLNDADDDMDLDIKGSIKGGIAR